MEASQHLGDAEECSSSESGWTMYLASPMHDGDDDSDGDDDNGQVEDDGGDASNSDDSESKGHDEGDEADDSMASDASIGPFHCRSSYKECDGRVGTGQRKHEEDDAEVCSQHPSRPQRKLNSSVEKKRDGKSTAAAHKPSGAGSFHSSSKVGKANLRGK